MKKFITFLSVFTLILSSCSKNDNAPQEDPQLAKKWGNMLGPWQITKLKRPDGSVVNFQSVCAGKIAVIDFTYDSNMTKEMQLDFFNTSCQVESLFEGYFVFDDNGVFIQNPLPFLQDGKVVSLTKNTMEIIIPTGTRTCEAFVGEATGYSLVRFQH
jgi:hypothetical protein